MERKGNGVQARKTAKEKIMDLKEWLAIQLYEKNGTSKWPNGVEEVTRCKWEVQSDCGEIYFETDSLLGFMEQYDNEMLDSDSYNSWLENNLKFAETVLAKRQENMQAVSEKMTKGKQLITEAYLLAKESGIPFYLDMGELGELDPAGDWQSSSC